MAAATVILLAAVLGVIDQSIHVAAEAFGLRRRMMRETEIVWYFLDAK